MPEDLSGPSQGLSGKREGRGPTGWLCPDPGFPGDVGLSIVNLGPGKLGPSWSPRGRQNREEGGTGAPGATSEAVLSGLGFILYLMGMEDSNSLLT